MGTKAGNKEAIGDRQQSMSAVSSQQQAILSFLSPEGRGKQKESFPARGEGEKEMQGQD